MLVILFALYTYSNCVQSQFLEQVVVWGEEKIFAYGNVLFAVLQNAKTDCNTGGLIHNVKVHFPPPTFAL